MISLAGVLIVKMIKNLFYTKTVVYLYCFY